MSGKTNPKGVVNTFRRTWDKEEYREKAEEREQQVGVAGQVATAMLLARGRVQVTTPCPSHIALLHCTTARPWMQESKVEDDALALKKRKRLERDPLHQVRLALLLPPFRMAGPLLALLQAPRLAGSM